MHKYCGFFFSSIFKCIYTHGNIPLKLNDIHFIHSSVSISDFHSDNAQRVEVDEMLRTMLEFEQNRSGKDSAQIALVAHCLAMLCFLGGDYLKVR